MPNSWSKEDKFHYNKSEVFKELEKIVLDTVRRADILQRKIAEDTSQQIQNLKGLEDQAKATEAAVSKITDSAAEDDEDLASDNDLQNEVIDDLRVLAEAALANNNIKLAYKIERTIDEILEQDVACE